MWLLVIFVSTINSLNLVSYKAPTKFQTERVSQEKQRLFEIKSLATPLQPQPQPQPLEKPLQLQPLSKPHQPQSKPLAKPLQQQPHPQEKPLQLQPLAKPHQPQSKPLAIPLQQQPQPLEKPLQPHPQEKPLQLWPLAKPHQPQSKPLAISLQQLPQPLEKPLQPHPQEKPLQLWPLAKPHQPQSKPLAISLQQLPQSLERPLEPQPLAGPLQLQPLKRPLQPQPQTLVRPLEQPAKPLQPQPKAQSTQLQQLQLPQQKLQQPQTSQDLLMKLNTNLHLEDSLNSISTTDDQDVSTSTPESTCNPEEEDREVVCQLDQALWEITFTQDALHSFLKLDNKMKSITMNRLMYLSQGHRTKKTAKPVPGFPGNLLYEIFLPHQYRLIWQTEISFSTNSQCFTEVIKVWDIVTADYTSKLVEKLNKRCKITKRLSHQKLLEQLVEISSPPTVKDDIIYPRSFRKIEGRNDAILDAEFVQQHVDSYIVDKFYEAPVKVLSSILSRKTGEGLELPLHVTDEEFSVINNTSSVLLIGRSGTGKTTCSVLRMWRRHQQHLEYSTNSETTANLHSLFLTVSPILSNHIQKFVQGLQASHGCPILDHKAIPNSLSTVPEENFPLIITFNMFIHMLDNTTKKPFFTNCIDEQTTDTKNSSPGLHNLMEYDIAQREQNRLVMCKEKTHTQKLRPVTYHVFESIWRQLVNKNKTLAIKYQPCIVWMEIMSHIKGSFWALYTEKGYIDLETYLQLGKKRLNISCNREEIYEMFLKYEQVKTKYRMYDIMDAIFHIFKQINSDGYQGVPIHNITVDEVQDCPEAMIQLLFLVSSNPNGFFFCGDTAQTIERGTSFRFCDLRSLFYHNKLRCNIPPVVTITKSFRSTAQILNLGNSVLELIEHYFPNTIDKLPKDEGIIEGDIPLVLDPTLQENLINFFLSEGNGGAIEFGHKQAIIIRNETKRKTLPKSLRSALIFTVSEAKGLEFDDVLVYNFFSDSPISTDWRVINAYQETNMRNEAFEEDNFFKKPNKKNKLSEAERSVEFQEAAHATLCSELKQLYMTITRAKSNLCFWDEKFDRRKPIEMFWLKRNLITTKDMKINISTSSSLSDWKQSGIHFFEQGKYRSAAHCFEKSGYKLGQKKAKAYHCAEKAKSLSEEELKNKEFHKAALLFLELADETSVSKEEQKNMRIYGAQCLYLSGNFLEAAKNFEILKNIDRECLKFAAQSYENCSFYVEAAHLQIELQNYDKAAMLLYLGKAYTELINFLYTEIFEKPIRRTKLKKIVTDTLRSFHKNNQKAKMIKGLYLLEPKVRILWLKARNYTKMAAHEILLDEDCKNAASLLISKHFYKDANKLLSRVPNLQGEAAANYLRQALFTMQMTWEYSDDVNEVWHQIRYFFMKAIKYYKKAGCLEEGIGNIIVKFSPSPNLLKATYLLLQNRTEEDTLMDQIDCLKKFCSLSDISSINSIEDFDLYLKLLIYYKDIAIQLSRACYDRGPSSCFVKGIDLDFVMKYFSVSETVDQNYVQIGTRYEKEWISKLEVIQYYNNTGPVVPKMAFFKQTSEIILNQAICIAQNLMDLLKIKLFNNEICSYLHCEHENHSFSELMDRRIQWWCRAVHFTSWLYLFYITFKASLPEDFSKSVLPFRRRVLERFFDELCWNPVEAELRYERLQTLDETIRNSYLDIAKHILMKNPPSPYFYNQNQTDSVLRSWAMFSRIAKDDLAFDEIYQKLSYTMRTTLIHDNFIQSERCLSQWKIREACHRIFDYLRDCQHQICLPTPKRCLDLITGYVLKSLLCFKLHFGKTFSFVIPLWYYKYYLGDIHIFRILDNYNRYNFLNFMKSWKYVIENYILNVLDQPYLEICWQTAILLMTLISNTYEDPEISKLFQHSLHCIRFTPKLTNLIDYAKPFEEKKFLCFMEGTGETQIIDLKTPNIEETSPKPDSIVIPVIEIKNPEPSKKKSEYVQRPGKHVCESYMKFKWCGYGMYCMFDHPVTPTRDKKNKSSFTFNTRPIPIDTVPSNSSITTIPHSDPLTTKSLSTSKEKDDFSPISPTSMENDLFDIEPTEPDIHVTDSEQVEPELIFTEESFVYLEDDVQDLRDVNVPDKKENQRLRALEKAKRFFAACKIQRCIRAFLLRLKLNNIIIPFKDKIIKNNFCFICQEDVKLLHNKSSMHKKFQKEYLEAERNYSTLQTHCNFLRGLLFKPDPEIIKNLCKDSDSEVQNEYLLEVEGILEELLDRIMVNKYKNREWGWFAQKKNEVEMFLSPKRK